MVPVVPSKQVAALAAHPTVTVVTVVVVVVVVVVDVVVVVASLEQTPLRQLRPEAQYPRYSSARVVPHFSPSARL